MRRHGPCRPTGHIGLGGPCEKEERNGCRQLAGVRQKLHGRECGAKKMPRASRVAGLMLTKIVTGPRRRPSRGDYAGPAEKATTSKSCTRSCPPVTRYAAPTRAPPQSYPRYSNFTHVHSQCAVRSDFFSTACTSVNGDVGCVGLWWAAYDCSCAAVSRDPCRANRTR